MKVGKKGTGQGFIDKLICARHGNGGAKRAADREERAIERRVRRQGKAECKRQAEEV